MSRNGEKTGCGWHEWMLLLTCCCLLWYQFLLCFRNFLFAPSDTNSYEFSTFTGIRDAFAEYLKARSFASDRENEARIAVEQQISMVTLAIQSAYTILSEDEYFWRLCVISISWLLYCSLYDVHLNFAKEHFRFIDASTFVYIPNISQKIDKKQYYQS